MISFEKYCCIILRTIISNHIHASIREEHAVYGVSGRENRWELSSGKLVFKHPEMDIFWQVPEDFTIPPLNILGLAEYVFLTPFKEIVILEPPKAKLAEVSFERNTNSKFEQSTPIVDGRKNVGVAFSGGVDSTAVLELLPSCVPIYTQVSKPSGMHKIENALLSVKEVGGVAVVSNCDELPKAYGKSKGYYGNAGFTTTGILFSEYYGLHTLADGNVLERMYLFGPNGHGTKYRDQDLSKIMEAFRGVGLEYCIPCAGMTEVVTTKIADRMGLKYSMGCMRGEKGEPCKNCLKCFRKRGLQGNPLPTNNEVEKKLDKEYIPMLPSLLWARDHKGLTHSKIDTIVLDTQWVDKWFEKSLEYIPEFLHEYFQLKLEELGIDTIEDPGPLLNFSSKLD